MIGRKLQEYLTKTLCLKMQKIDIGNDSNFGVYTYTVNTVNFVINEIEPTLVKRHYHYSNSIVLNYELSVAVNLNRIVCAHGNMILKVLIN